MKDANWINNLENEIGGIDMGREKWLKRFEEFAKVVDTFTEEMNTAFQAGELSKAELEDFAIVCALRYPKQEGHTSVIMVGSSKGMLNAGFAISKAFEQRHLPFAKMLTMKMMSDMLENKKEDDEDE